MSRASDAYTDFINAGGHAIGNEAQPEKCAAARIEQAKADLEAKGFTVTKTETE
ncbi:hypothetical protein ACC761_06395 [Rhizobium ruizarguesonis]